MPSGNECLHANQRLRDGVWVCKLCGDEIPVVPTDPKDYGSIGFGGLDAFRQFRRIGQTQSEMTRDNIARFRKDKGYDPVSEKEFYG